MFFGQLLGFITCYNSNYMTPAHCLSLQFSASALKSKRHRLEKAHRLGSLALGGAVDLMGWIPGVGSITKGTIQVLHKAHRVDFLDGWTWKPTKTYKKHGDFKICDFFQGGKVWLVKLLVMGCLVLEF